MSTLNEMIMSAIAGAEADEGISTSDPTPVLEKTASPVVEVDDLDIEKIASALEWYGTTGIGTIAELDKQAADMRPDLGKIRMLMSKGMAAKQAVAMAHPQMPAAARAKIVAMLSGEKLAYEKETAASPEEHKSSPSMKAMSSAKASAPKSSKSNSPDTDEGHRLTGEQPDPRDADATHHSSLSSNDSAIRYTKAEKSKLQSKSLGRVLDNKPFADSSLRRLLDAANSGGIDPNIHATKTASDKDVVLSQVKEALANKLSQRVSEAN